jgi:hypothetical protein
MEDSEAFTTDLMKQGGLANIQMYIKGLTSIPVRPMANSVLNLVTHVFRKYPVLSFVSQNKPLAMKWLQWIKASAVSKGRRKSIARVPRKSVILVPLPERTALERTKSANSAVSAETVTYC